MELGTFENGGALLTTFVQKLFGQNSLLLLGFAIICACLTISVGLVSACGDFFKKILPNVSYTTIIFIICLFSFVVSNLGLSMLIKNSLPILIIMYSVAIALIVLDFFDCLIGEQ
ncbi:branched-chain amino acid transport system II carrier protein [Bacillus wiedmannii]|uniref:branched-chain amino acid transport system II carrier protein n=1 Tax=Bacillus wiedmannii TaxID=1890302 RepID=UPI003BF5A134